MDIRQTNPDKKIQLKIDEYFNKLEVLINKIPLKEKGRNYIWQYSFIQFYDTPIQTENGEYTYGIQTEWQLNQFIKQFKTNFKKLRISRIEAYIKELDNLPPLIAKDKLNNELQRIKRKEILGEIGGGKPTNWDNWLLKFLSNEIEHRETKKITENKISFVELEKCFYLIGYYIHEDKKVIEQLLDFNFDFTNNFLKQFAKELNLNILLKDSTQGKKDIIKHYIFEFWELQHFFKIYSKILFENPFKNYSPTEYISAQGKNKIKLSKFENYVINSWIILDMLFNEIQIVCIKYDFDFNIICKDLKFDLFLDKSISRYFNTKNKVEIAGFQSNLKEKQIESLYEQMQDNYFETSLENFNAIFQPDLKNFTPIKRTKIFTNTLLIYFTSKMFQKENPLDYVSITEYCFNAKRLSQTQNNYIQYNHNQKPKGYKDIDTIIQSIYNHL